MAAPKSPNTVPARMGKKMKARQRAEAAGTLEEVRLKLWRCLGRVEKIAEDEDADPALTLRAVHCLSQTASTYVKLTEAGELEKRMDALEETLKGRRGMASSGAYA